MFALAPRLALAEVSLPALEACQDVHVAGSATVGLIHYLLTLIRRCMYLSTPGTPSKYCLSIDMSARLQPADGMPTNYSDVQAFLYGLPRQSSHKMGCHLLREFMYTLMAVSPSLVRPPLNTEVKITGPFNSDSCCVLAHRMG
jgi:hypothetical protein